MKMCIYKRKFNIFILQLEAILQKLIRMFVEFRKDPTCPVVEPTSVAEIYIGTCECATMKDWELCSMPLRKSRPYECYLDDLEPTRRNGSARVHRRLCDPTKMYQRDQACDCTVPFAQRTLYPVKGFLTCYRAPLPRSICSTHSVCGVYNCEAKFLHGISMVYCDPLCLGKQPFCEEVGPVTSRPPVVTSYWSEWTCPHKDDVLEVSESICIDKETSSPAFDCLGPGSFCCPPQMKDCRCEVSTTMAEMKLTRFIFKQDIAFKKRQTVRSAYFANREKRGTKKLWEKLKKGLNIFGKRNHLPKAITQADCEIAEPKVLNLSSSQQDNSLQTTLFEEKDSISNKKILNTNQKKPRKMKFFVPSSWKKSSEKQAKKSKQHVGSSSYMVINYKPVRPENNFIPEEVDDSPWRNSRYILGNNSKYNYLQEFNFFAPRR
ncbi:uncharacterized protein isoform X2 [Rhodnius prolixus]|uniref:uncharacterized protein isoform X2 n=1 Tax=Rhodnius prolixus TaxID=13249 RepID=UPI003D18C309